MELMAKKKSVTVGRARDRGEVSLLHVEISKAHETALTEFKTRSRLSKRAIVELALEQYLAGVGAWETSRPD